jgi:ketosteroid isomerase-like protein
MSDDLITFTHEMDRCWMERRFSDLSSFIADDIVVVAPGGRQRVKGLDAAMHSYDEFMRRCTVSRFGTSNHIVTERGATAVVEYEWGMAWSDEGVAHEAMGREILALARGDKGWRVIWRAQLSA